MKTILICLFLAALAAAPTASAAVTSTVVVIDSSTVQPVSAGLPPVMPGDSFILMVDGAMQPFNNSSHYATGWFGPEGETRLQRLGQPMSLWPYGAVGVSSGATYSGAQFVGEQGARVSPGSHPLGYDIHLFTNMSDTDLAAANGQFTVTVIVIPEGEALHTEVVIDASTGNTVPTGLMCNSVGDRFIILPFGALNVSFSSGDYDGDWFGPEGKAMLNTSALPLPNAPYGALLGNFTPSDPSQSFFVMDGGDFRCQPVDLGKPLHVGVNLNDAILAVGSGRFIVNVIQIPDPALAAATEGVPQGVRLDGAYPNPLNPSTTIAFELGRGEDVRLRVYDVSGRWIRTLVDERRGAGEHRVVWDGLDDAGRPVASGSYLYQLSTSEGSRTGRVAVVK